MKSIQVGFFKISEILPGIFQLRCPEERGCSLIEYGGLEAAKCKAQWVTDLREKMLADFLHKETKI